jgi:hypothetical protein
MRKTKPAGEEGVQMETRSRFASRSDAGKPAFDLCKHGGKVKLLLDNVKGNRSVARVLVESVEKSIS